MPAIYIVCHEFLYYFSFAILHLFMSLVYQHSKFHFLFPQNKVYIPIFSLPYFYFSFFFSSSFSTFFQSEAAAARLKKIFPQVRSEGVVLTIPMPGHPFSSEKNIPGEKNVPGEKRESDATGGSGTYTADGTCSS